MTAADLANHRRADADAIVPEDAFFLAMYRHWALYDALYHSSYIATKLGSWRDKGQSRLHRFLLQMGMPLKESLQLYSEMDIKYRRSLPEKLLSVAARYNLDEIVFPSF
ncbi:CDC45-like protein, partial [Caulochytrium protostelioides]